MSRSFVLFWFVFYFRRKNLNGHDDGRWTSNNLQRAFNCRCDVYLDGLHSLDIPSFGWGSERENEEKTKLNKCVSRGKNLPPPPSKVIHAEYISIYSFHIDIFLYIYISVGIRSGVDVSSRVPSFRDNNNNSNTLHIVFPLPILVRAVLVVVVVVISTRKKGRKKKIGRHTDIIHLFEDEGDEPLTGSR